jgi:acetyl-CoA carboxylase biotin carboxyl carrier protein
MKDIDEILKLLNALTELPFESMEVSTQELTVKVSRGGASAAPAQPARAERALPKAGSAQEAADETDVRAVAVASPIIGVFYAAPAPGEEPFVKAGDTVSAGQVLCIVEAMKLMNEIPSPVSGKVLKVLAEDGSEVEVGQTLFLVEASEG